MTHKRPSAERAGSGRVSPTATSEQSPSTAVWRLLENDPRFVDGMDRAGAEFDSGQVVPSSEFLKGRRRSR